nr:NYN domain-containing protein [Chlorogloea sp. CCALA 695]
MNVVEKPNISSDSQERVAIFIDGSNLVSATTHLNIKIDYTKLLHYLTKKRKLLRAYFYTSVDSTNKRQQSFLLWMRRSGYRVVAKELIQHPDGSKKANLEVEIAIDMLTLAKDCDTFVLLSGEEELTYAVNAVSYQGIRVEVISLGLTSSDSLLSVADYYSDLKEIKQNIQLTAD